MVAVYALLTGVFEKVLEFALGVVRTARCDHTADAIHGMDGHKVLHPIQRVDGQHVALFEAVGDKAGTKPPIERRDK